MKSISEILSVVKQKSPILYWIVIIQFVGAMCCIPGIFLDDRILMGINVWAKPFKFFISTGIYTLTVGFLITLYPYSKKKKHIIRNMVSWTLLFEMVIVTFQAARGVQSHYNMSNVFDGVLFGIMGILIAMNVLIMILFAIDTLRLKLMTTKAIQWAILLGWLITIIGSWVGGQMIGQMAHNVGVQDGGDGLPLLNWSTIAGDLRVAHFFGLHGLQIVPIFAFILFKYWKRSHHYQVILITFFALLYASFIFYTFYQASQGIPFLTDKSIMN
jgi:hypothetical protein